MIIKADVDSSVHQGLAAEALSYEDRYIYVGDKLRNFIDQKMLT